MRKSIYYLSLLLLAMVLPTGCSSDEENEIQPVDENANKTFPIAEDKLDPGIVSFFNETLPKMSYYSIEDFFMLEDKETDVYYLINNEQEFQKVYQGHLALPKIDFKKYTLIIGRLYNGGVTVYQQYLTKEKEENVLVLHLRHEPVVALMFYTYYWGIYPKMTNDYVTIQLVHDK